MSDALIAKLRDHENEGVTGSDRFHLRNEAADALSALREERDRLRKAWQEVRREAFANGEISFDRVNEIFVGCLAALGERSGERE